MTDIDQTLKTDDLIDNQVVEFAETCANNRINALTESLSDLRRSYNDLKNEYDGYIEDTEELHAKARSQQKLADGFKKSVLELVGLDNSLSDVDVLDLIKYILKVSARIYSSRVSLLCTVGALSEIREEMLLGDDTTPTQIATSVRQYVNLNNHLLNVIDEVATQRLGSRAQSAGSSKFDLDDCSPEEAFAERVRMIRELGESAVQNDRFNELFNSAIKAVQDETVEGIIQELAKAPRSGDESNKSKPKEASTEESAEVEPDDQD